MKIAVDLDDTLGDFAGAFLNFCNKKFDMNYSYSDMTFFYGEGLFGFSKDKIIELVNEFYSVGDHEVVEPFEDALKIISFLKKKHELIIVTSRPEVRSADTLVWIEKHFPDVFSGVHHAKFPSTEKSNKAQICKNLGVDVIIDDALHHHEGFASEGIKSILIDKPWNKAETLSESITRVDNWHEALEEIKKIEKGL